MVMAPEHPLIDKYADRISNMDEVENYRTECGKKTEFERTQLVKDKTGVKLSGLTAVNPVNGKEIPIFISDYVMMGYGTGAIMAVPAHDQRDWDFAKAFGIDIIQVIKGGDIEKEAYTGDGEMINSDFLNGTDNKKESIEKMLEFLKERGIGEKGVQYKMKDWAFNRQRYWGEPIPIIHCPHCGMVAVPENELPLKLPDVENFEPGEGGESPLAKIDSFVNCTCPKCGAPRSVRRTQCPSGQVRPGTSCATSIRTTTSALQTRTSSNIGFPSTGTTAAWSMSRAILSILASGTASSMISAKSPCPSRMRSVRVSDSCSARTA